jgi:hypothetical protein
MIIQAAVLAIFSVAAAPAGHSEQTPTRVCVSVIDSSTLAGLPAMVRIYSRGDLLTDRLSDETGTACFAPLDPGWYSIRAESAGYWERSSAQILKLN